jgi:hypothetical protein
MRLVFGVVLAVSVGVGGYFGSAQVATSARTPPRTVALNIGDVAVVGQVRCLAVTDSRSQPIRNAYMRCSARPHYRAPYWVDVLPTGYIVVWKKAVTDPVYTTPQ